MTTIKKTGFGSRPKDPACVSAINRFISKHNLSYSQLARILGVDSKAMTLPKNGYRPYSGPLARLYILINDEALKPMDGNEAMAYAREIKNPPKSLVKFTLTGEVPKPKPDVRRCQNSLVSPSLGKPKEKRGPPHFDSILSGAAEVRDQSRKKLRFILTEDSFRQLDGDVSEVEIDDTRMLIQELRRRFAVFAQLKKSEIRAKLIRELSGEINELYMTIEFSRSAFPVQAAFLLADLRKQLEEIKIPSQKEDKK